MKTSIRKLDAAFTCEIDVVDEAGWGTALRSFDDANIYQTWAYGAVTAGVRNMSHVVLRHHGDIVAIAQARVVKVPMIPIGIAYIRWGPLWRLRASQEDPAIFRQALRALRDEFSDKRGLALRLYPPLFEGRSTHLTAILGEEGFSRKEKAGRERTILIDLSASHEELRNGMGRNWKRSLRVAEQGSLEVVEGEDDALFELVNRLYGETVARKKFAAARDSGRYAKVQRQLPDGLKMKAMVCKTAGEPCAGVIWSAIGSTGIELVAATSAFGMKGGASHLLRWRVLERLKEAGCAWYDLNGINPETNPGTYRFKRELAGSYGHDVTFLGRLDADSTTPSDFCVELGERTRTFYRAVIRRAAQVLPRTSVL